MFSSLPHTRLLKVGINPPLRNGYRKKTQKLTNAEVEVTTLDAMPFPMELHYTGQCTINSWKLHNYLSTREQVYYNLYYGTKNWLQLP